MSKKRYLKHLDCFMKEFSLYPEVDTDSFVGVSGGVDSLSLWYALIILFKKKGLRPPSGLHLNHGTRDQENKKERALLFDFAKKEGVSLFTKRVELDLKGANFEAQARAKRQGFFNEYLEKNSILYLGHTIDDSFEWSLMQSFKASDWKKGIGIPLVHGKIRRPFHCFSKKHVYQFADTLGLSWKEDSSNTNLKFERNRIRHHLSFLKEDYPSYLKNYVTQANDKAKRLSLYLGPLSSAESIEQVKSSSGTLLLSLEKGDFLGQDELVRKSVQELSLSNRGVLREQVKKCIKGQAQGKKGPLSFSGGVKSYMERGSLLFVTEKMEKKLLFEDAKFKELTTASQIPKGSFSFKIPLWVFEKGKEQKIKAPLEGRKKSHPLFPKLFEYCRNNDLSIWSYSHFVHACKKKGLNPYSFDLYCYDGSNATDLANLEFHDLKY